MLCFDFPTLNIMALTKYVDGKPGFDNTLSGFPKFKH